MRIVNFDKNLFILFVFNFMMMPIAQIIQHSVQQAVCSEFVQKFQLETVNLELSFVIRIRNAHTRVYHRWMILSNRC